MHPDHDRLDDALPRHPRDARAAVALHLDDAVALEYPQRLTHRHDAGVELAGELGKTQALTGRQVAARDPVAELCVHPLRLGLEPERRVGGRHDSFRPYPA
jgi:hypothetical protein